MFPIYRTKEIAKKEMDHIERTIREVAAKGGAETDQKKRTAALQEIEKLKKELKKAAANYSEIQKSGIPDVIGETKSPAGWPPYFGRGIAGDVTVSAEGD